MDFELDIIHFLQSLRNTFLDFFFESSTILGEEVTLIIVLGYVYWCYDKVAGEKMGFIIFISLSVNNLLKVVFQRTRPYLVDSTIENLRPETSQGYSFPSGHTQIASTTFFGLYYLIKKNWLLILAIIASTLVAISRMYIGVHYLTDVLAGLIIGIFIAYYISKYYDKIRNMNMFYSLILIISIFIFIIALIYYYLINVDQGILDAHIFYLDGKFPAKLFGTVGGFIVGIFYEKKYVNFQQHNNILKNILRFILGITIVIGILFILKYTFLIVFNPDNLVNQGFMGILSLILVYLRYFVVVFIGIGMYPKLFKYLNI